MSDYQQGEVVPLGSLLKERPQNGYSPICSPQPTGKWVLGLSALTGKGLDISCIKPVPDNDSVVDRFSLSPGDFLISRSNTIDKVGRVAVYKGGLSHCSYPDLMMRFRPDPSAIDPRYLEAYLQSAEVVKYIQRHAAGTSGSMKKINRPIVEAIPVLRPSREAQERIVLFQQASEAATETLNKLIAAKNALLQTVYQKLFGNAAVTRQDWKPVIIEDLLVPRTEKRIPSQSLPLYSLTIEAGITPKTRRYNREFLVKNTSSKEYKVVYPGDIVFNPANLRWGAIARADTKKQVAVSPVYEVLRIREDLVNSALLTHVLTSRRQIAIFATKTEGTLLERMAVKLGSFLATEIWLPKCRSEQDKLAKILDAAKCEQAHLSKLKALLQLQYDAIIHDLLRGARTELQ